MELIIIILFAFIVIIFYKIRTLNKRLTGFLFLERNIYRLLVKKKIIKLSEINTIINESIGDMFEDDGNKIIKYAKDIGITIPGYMDEKNLNEYIEKQELKRKYDKMSYTDKMLM